MSEERLWEGRVGEIINNISIYLCTHNVTPQQQHTLFAGTSRLLLFSCLYMDGVDDLCITCLTPCGTWFVNKNRWYSSSMALSTHTHSLLFSKDLLQVLYWIFIKRGVSARRDILLLTCQFIYYILTFIILIRLYTRTIYTHLYLCALEPIAWIDFFFALLFSPNSIYFLCACVRIFDAV